MKLYELTYLMPIDLSEEVIKSTQEKVSSFIVENQGTIYKIEEITKRRLGEETKKNNVANMATLSFYFAPEKLENLKKNLKTDANVMNNIIIYKEPRKRMQAPRRMRPVTVIQEEPKEIKTSEKPKKVEIKEIEKKLEEILGE